MAENFPVFPVVIPKPDGSHSAVGGIMLRDYFAAKAMQGFAADPSSHDLFEDMGEVAENAYAMADAMLKARESNQ